MGDFIHFKDLIPKAIAHYKMDREARAAMICARFRTAMPNIVGADAVGNVNPKFFKNGTLVLTVPNSVWAQRVYVNRHELLVQLNLHLDKPWVEDIRAYVE